MAINKNKVFRLLGKVQHYAWGGKDFLPEFLGRENKEEQPFAEYWMGAHEKSSAAILYASDRPVLLSELIAANPEYILGDSVHQQFGRLPYLLKILDVKDMLSIQVHPTKKNAEKGYFIENQAGIAIDALNRNYKDDNHKPELMLALSEFWLLHGFKPQDKLIRMLEKTPELQSLVPVFANGDYRALYAYVMELNQQKVNALLEPLLDRVVPIYQQNKLNRDQEDFWAARASLTYLEKGKIDRGIFSIYFFNLLHMHPGQAIFQDAGLPHAYLEGQNVEIMANSDNVLRGGLTPKYVDVKELLQHIRFEPTFPNILGSGEDDQKLVVFKTAAPDFELSRISLNKGETITLTAHSVQIFILLKGMLLVKENSENEFALSRGESFVGFDTARIELTAESDAELYRAAVPEPRP